MTKAFVGEDNIISVDTNYDDKKLNLSLWGNTFYTCDKEIVTYYKNDYHIRQIKEFSHGMSIFMVFDRLPIVEKNIDVYAFLDGVSIYQEFDENTWKNIPYLYKFDKDNLEIIDSIFQNLGVDAKLQGENGFVKLEWETNSHEDIVKNIESRIQEEDFLNILSFLFGIALVYGDFDIVEDNLNSAKLFIPLVGNLSDKGEVFDNIFEFLSKHWVFNKVDYIQQDIGFLYQVSIVDWEILTTFLNFLNEIGIDEVERVSKKDKISDYKEWIKNFLHDEFYSIDENFDDLLYEGVLKVLEK